MIGTGAPPRGAVVVPNAVASLLELIVGSIARGMPKKPSSSSSQSSVVRSISIVRLALVTSVVCTPPSGPPVRFQTTQVSGVPKRASPRSAAARSAVDVLEHPLHLAGGEVRGGRQPGLVPDDVTAPVGIQRLGDRVGAGVLPDDGVVERAAGVAVPDDRRLALVRHADGVEVGAGDAGLPQRAADDGLGAVPDLERVVLDPAGAGEQLLVLELVLGHRSPVVVEDDEPRARRALVDRADEVTHGPILGGRRSSPLARPGRARHPARAGCGQGHAASPCRMPRARARMDPHVERRRHRCSSGAAMRSSRSGRPTSTGPARR